MNYISLTFDGVSCLGCVKAIERKISKYDHVEITNISQNSGDTVIFTKLSQATIINDLKSFDGCCDSCNIELSTTEIVEPNDTVPKENNNNHQLIKKQYEIALQRAINGIEVSCSEQCVCKTTDFDRMVESSTPSFASVYNLSDYILSYIKAGMNIVDFGSGTGHDAFQIANISKNVNITGIDLTPSMVCFANAQTKEQLLTNVKFIEGSDLTIIPKKSQDLIYTNNVFNLLPNKNEFIRECYQTLKTGGYLIIADEFSKKSLPPDIDNDPKFQCGGISGAKSKDFINNICTTEGFIQKVFQVINQYEIEYHNIKYPLETGILILQKS